MYKHLRSKAASITLPPPLHLERLLVVQAFAQQGSHGARQLLALHDAVVGEGAYHVVQSTEYSLRYK